MITEIATKENNAQTLPAGWKWVRLRDICKEIYRYPSFYGMEHLNKGVPVIRGEHIDDTGELSANWTDYWYVSEDLSQRFHRTILNLGDIVFTVRGTIGKVGIVRGTHVSAQISPNLIRISPDESVTPEYLWRYLKSLKDTSQAVEDNSVTVATVKASDLENLSIPLPPLPEQKRIAAILNEQMAAVENARAACEAQLEAAKALPAAYLRSVFESEEAKKWERRTIASLSKTCSGSTPSRDKKEYYEGDIPWVKTGELKDNVIFDTEEHISQKALEETSVRLLPKNTLLIAMYGQGQTRGRTALLAKPSTTNQACFAILPNQNLFVPEFLQLWFMHNYKRLREETEGRGGNQPNLNGGVLKTQEIELPPLSKQNEIVASVSARLAKIATTIELLESQNATIDTLPSAILRQAFRGEFKEQSLDTVIHIPPHLFLNKAAIASYIVNGMYQQHTFGRVQLQKMLYLTESHIGIDLSSEYVREAAGPLDKSIYALENSAKKKGWIKVIPRTGKFNGGKAVGYAPGSKMSEPMAMAETILGDKKANIDRLIGLFSNIDTEKAEIVATLFAAWNDFIIDGITPNDESTIREVRENWHPRKQRFSANRLSFELSWMRKNNLVPTGIGQKTVVKSESKK